MSEPNYVTADHATAERVTVVDAGGVSFRARLEPAPAGEDDAQVVLRLDDGVRVQVARNLLTPTENGRYNLGANLSGYLSGAGTARPEGEQAVITLAEETLRIGKRTVEGRVRLHKTVSERLETVDVPLVREQVEVERVSVNRPVEEAEGVRMEGEVMVIPRYEEVLVVSKQLVLVEEVRVRTLRTERREPQQVTLRREELSVERDADPES